VAAAVARGGEPRRALGHRLRNVTLQIVRRRSHSHYGRTPSVLDRTLDSGRRSSSVRHSRTQPRAWLVFRRRRLGTKRRSWDTSLRSRRSRLRMN
jgi:hypothetical protein